MRWVSFFERETERAERRMSLFRGGKKSFNLWELYLCDGELLEVRGFIVV